MTHRRLRLLFLAFSCVVLALPGAAQQVIATVPVGITPRSSAVNPVTNRIYVPSCGTDPNCSRIGILSVLDGATNDILAVINVGYSPLGVAVNSVTNKIYVANQCGNPCESDGTVSVIDGASNTVIATLTAGRDSYAVAVNSVTNKIYVANSCGNDLTCVTRPGTVTVIDGASNTVTATVNVGAAPAAPVVNAMTNKIYVPNQCGNDPTCGAPRASGTVTVIDGVTNQTHTVNVGVVPDAADVNTQTNRIYVANACGNDPNCQSTTTATVTVIDGATLATTTAPIGGHFPQALAVNSATNKIYASANCFGEASCQGEPNGTVSVIDGVTLAYTSVPTGPDPDTLAVNSATNKVYVANYTSCGSYCLGTVTVIDGATLAYANLLVGSGPDGLSVDSTTNRIYVPDYNDGTVSVIDGTPPTATQFVPLSQPCRAVDTRPPGGGGPIPGGTSQNFAISGEGACAVLPNAAVYSLNVTVVPGPTLGYLTIWPAGQPQPVVSTMNSVDKGCGSAFTVQTINPSASSMSP